MSITENTSNINNNWPYHGSKLIPKEDLKPFLKRDNISGLKHLFLHLLLILATGVSIYLSPSVYLTILLMFIHGTFIAFLYAGLHECIHKTAFKNRKLNEIVGYLIGFILLRSFLNGRYRHIAHHTYTQHMGVQFTLGWHCGSHTRAPKRFHFVMMVLMKKRFEFLT